MTRRFCAICTDQIDGVPRMEPLGRNDAMVACCASCVDEPAIARTGPVVDYDAPEERGAHAKGMDAAYPGRRLA